MVSDVSSTLTSWFYAFNYYFLVMALIMALFEGVFMVKALGFDLLFTILFTVFWCTPLTLNLTFIVASDKFKTNFLIASYWTVWFSTLCQLIMVFMCWQITSGGVASYFMLNYGFSSVTFTVFNIGTYLLQSGLFIGYTFLLRKDLGLGNQ